MASSAMSAPAESFFSIVGHVFTKPKSNLGPATTKMLTVVKNKVTKIRLCDIDSGIQSVDTNIDDEPCLSARNTREINGDLGLCPAITRFIDDNSDEKVMDNED